MALPERDYYPLSLAASIIGCSSEDLIHWGANGKIRLGVIFSLGLGCMGHVWEAANGEEKAIDDSFGFAFVEKYHLALFEKDHHFVFDVVTLLDGTPLLLQKQDKVESINGLFLHRNELLSLVQVPNTRQTFDAIIPDKPIDTGERNKLLMQIAALSLALAEKSKLYKRGGRPNALQIANLTVEILDALPNEVPHGVGNSSIRDSIKDGLKLLTTPKD